MSMKQLLWLCLVNMFGLGLVLGYQGYAAGSPLLVILSLCTFVLTGVIFLAGALGQWSERPDVTAQEARDSITHVINQLEHEKSLRAKMVDYNLRVLLERLCTRN